MSARPHEIIRYGELPRQHVRLFPPDAGSPEGSAVLLVHGGFWRAEKDSASLEFACAELAAGGVLAASVGYRTVECGGVWPMCAQDVASAVRAFWRRTAVAPRRTVLAGHSAGGHLALMAAELVPQVGGVAGLAAVSDAVAAYRDDLGDGAVSSLVGGDVDDVVLREISPAHSRQMPARLLLVHGAEDQTVPIQQSYSYYAAATRRGATVRLVVVPGARHMHLVKPDRPAWSTVRRELLSFAGAAGRI